MRCPRWIQSLAAAACVVVAPLAQDRPPSPQPDDSRVERMKHQATEEVDAMATFTQQMVDQIFSYGELGFQEFETHRYLVDVLRKNGFTVQEGIAGIPTAFMATWGSGKPVLALGSDIDGIPQASQKPGVAYHSPLIDGAPGHGEGHNSGQAVNITAAIAVKKLMEREKLSGTIRVWPGTAEELVGTKAYFVREGFFKDVDVALFTHVDNDLGVSWGDRQGTGLVSVEYSFRGQTAHSAGAPWRGRSALDAVELMNIGWNYRREHLPLEHRSHYVVTNGGDQPNVVPRTASVWYYFRQTTYPKIKELWGIGDNVARGAAMMTGTELLEQRVLGSAWPQHFNKVIAETTWANIQKVGMPQWSEADQQFARAFQRAQGAPERGLATNVPDRLSGRESIPDSEQQGGASDDIGDIMWSIPTVTLRFPSNIPGATGHHWTSAVSMATPVAHKGATQAAKVEAMTALDLLM
jgi:aminobenzoyl-glutamate utilization protein B